MRVLAVVFLLVTTHGCRLFRGDEYERRDRCAMHLPVLRGEPEEAYRVIKIIKDAKDDDDLAWKACAVGADAVISQMDTEIDTRVNVGGGPYFVVGRSNTKGRTRIRGLAIRYMEQPEPD